MVREEAASSYVTSWRIWRQGWNRDTYVFFFFYEVEPEWMKYSALLSSISYDNLQNDIFFDVTI